MNKRMGLGLLAGLMLANVLVWAWVPSVLARRDSVFDQLDLLVDIRHELVEKYVEPPDQSKMVQAGIKGMIDSLNDPYTVFINPQELSAFDKQIRGSFSGIGAEIDRHEGRVRIVSPLEGSPAWKAGVLAGDVILEINGESTEGLELTEAVEKLTGPEGSQVTIKVRHEAGEEATFTITRARINVQTVKGVRRHGEGHWDFMLDPAGKIGYIRVTQFTEQTTGELRTALKALNDQGVRGLILDFRFDPGGLLESAVEIASMFLDKGQRVVSVKGRTVSERVHYSTGEQLLPPSVPLAVLANEFSASASEVVTGALTDNGRARFIGTRTFGKGSVQQVLMLDNGQGALKLTNAYYYLPGGRNIHRREGAETWGVDPSEGSYVRMTPEQARQMMDVRRQGDILRRPNGERAAEVGTVTPQWIEEQLHDPQLAAALRAVSGKLGTGEWPRVGEDGTAVIARQIQYEGLTRQRDAIRERLDAIEKELARLDDPAVPADEPAADLNDVEVRDGQAVLPVPEVPAQPGTPEAEEQKKQMPAEIVPPAEPAPAAP